MLCRASSLRRRQRRVLCHDKAALKGAGGRGRGRQRHRTAGRYTGWATLRVLC